MRNGCPSPKDAQASSTIKNRNAGRPPASLLAKDREKRDQAKLSGLDISSLLQKAVNTPIQSQPHEVDELEQDLQEDAIIDIEREGLDKILAEENVKMQSIHEVNNKWHSEEEQEFRTLTGKYAVDFLKTMNGTLCYLMVAFRLLAKAPWTLQMVCVHVRQAALYAISKGWFFHTLTSHGIQFSRAEMALAAGTFLGDLTPNLPDDPDQPLFLTIHELPHICASLFSTGRAICKCCGQTKSMPVPTFASVSPRG